MFDHINNKIGPGWVEIRTGIGRRRRWSDEQKARIVAEAFAPELLCKSAAQDPLSTVVNAAASLDFNVNFRGNSVLTTRTLT